MVQKQVMANQQGGWFNTNIFVNAGDQLDIIATDQPSTNPYPWGGGPRIDPDGNRSDGVPRSPWSQSIHPSACFGMLVGRIGTNDSNNFIVGSTYSGGAAASGFLYLAFNDGVNFNDNGGYWDVDITVSSAAGFHYRTEFNKGGGGTEKATSIGSPCVSKCSSSVIPN